MFGNRRLAKRSIVGTKVSALWKDGRFYPGVITDHPSDPGIVDEMKYTVVFDDGFQRDVPGKYIIGTGFQNVSSFKLKYGQSVYLTLNGREIPGLVEQHDTDQDCVTIDVQVNGESHRVERKIDDVRLLESRKSARLVDQDTDYSKLADVVVHTTNTNIAENRKRPVSHVIDVPSALAPRYRRTIDEEDRRDVPLEEEGGDMDVDMMDETIAAMVLTSLSTSPASPNFPASFQDAYYKPAQHLSSSVSSSGFHSERSDPSPPSSHLSESAPASSSGFFPASSLKEDDIDIDIDEEDDGFSDVMEPRKRLKIRKMRFRCTWKGCKNMAVTRSDIERHVRTAHLGCKESDSDLSDHEEEFYYTEIEENVENVTQKFSEMCTASPPDRFYGDGDLSAHNVTSDHDYQKKYQNKIHASSVPSGGFFKHGMTPPSMPEIRRSLSWQNNALSSSPVSPTSQPIRMTKPSSQGRLQQHQAQSPKSHSYTISKSGLGYKKPRSDVRKCRKVYGMENRDMWCTQCKWKKACSRFVD